MSIQRAPLLHRLLQKMLRQDSILILDLEDTLSNLDPKKAKSIKAWGRAELVQFARDYPHLFDHKQVGVRVNSLSSGEFEHDLKALAEISEIWNLHCILGPKINSPEEIQVYVSSLNQVRYASFIPIIETIKGMQNLSQIVGHECVTDALYGHQDFCLDSGYWPFFEQDEPEFWSITSHFIQTIERAGVRYIHPPIAKISNEALFTQVYLRLQRECHLPFGIATINSTQTALFNHLNSIPLKAEESELKSKPLSMRDRIDQALYAQKICSRKERNFLIDPATQKFFSPHMYIAALQFLEHIDD